MEKDSVKLFELSKEFDMPHTEFIPLINKLGFDIKGFSKVLSAEEAENIRKEVKRYYIEDALADKAAKEAAELAIKQEQDAKKAKIKEYNEHNVANMIGTYFCPIKNRYYIVETKLDPFQLRKLELLEGKGYGSVYNLNYDFNLKLGKRKILKPAELANARKWGKLIKEINDED